MTNGKPDPVFSLDMHPTNVLATAGVDGDIPPRGSVHVSRVLRHLKCGFMFLFCITGFVLHSCGKLIPMVKAKPS
jgi:hypothetical protein